MNAESVSDSCKLGTRAARAALFSVFASVALGLIKIISGVVGNSQALIADGIESAMDVFSSLMVTAGIRVARKPPDADHPYGHGKAETLAGMFAALVLIVAAIAIAVNSSLGIFSPQEVPESFTLFVLIGVIIFKEITYRRLLKVGIETGSTSLQSDAWHHRSDALTSLSALCGIGAALAGGPDWAVADEYGAIAASAFMLFQGQRLFRISVREIMDTQVDESLEESIRSAASRVAGVRGLDKCRVRKSGFDYIVEIHILVDGSLSVHEGHILAHKVKDHLKGANLGVLEAIVHVEPHKV